MSLILEALRRSEAERQLGRAPDVLAPMPVLRVSHRARRWPWAALALVLTVLALLGLWRYMQKPAITTITPAVSTVTQPTAHVQANAASAAQHAMTTSTVVPVVARQSPPTAPPASIPVTMPPKAAVAPAPSAASADTPDLPIPTNPPTAPIATETAPASADALLSIADLSPADRAALPALKVSMHVYAEQPGDRFMIVDGARVGEGARLGDRIVLVQIRRDGGVLDIGGRRVLLPKP